MSLYDVCIDLHIDHIAVDIIIPSVPVAGDMFNLTCVVVLPPNFVENITSIRWTYDLEASRDVTDGNNDASVAPTIRNQNILTSILTLNPVKTSDATDYYCRLTIVLFDIVDRTNMQLTVKSKLLLFYHLNYFLQYFLPVYH